MSINSKDSQNSTNLSSSSQTQATTGLKKFIRFKGLIGFFMVISLLLVFLYLFAEAMVKTAIEQGGGAMLGAEVNVASVELDYSPLILTIIDLQATDAERPEYNLFSFKQASAGIELWQYLLGKTIIEQLNVEQLELATKRSEIGDVYLQKDDEQDVDANASLMPAMDLQLPEVKSLLKDSNLLTVQAGAQLQQSYAQEQVKLLALKEKLPSKAKLKAYQVKIKAISEMKVKSLADFEKVKAEFDAVKRHFKADQAIVKQAQEQLLASKTLLTSQLTALKNAPSQDWQQIEKKYQLDSVSTDDFAQLLFGEQARGYYQKAEALYQRIAPYLSKSLADKKAQQTIKNIRSKGRFVYFTEDNPLPSFLIKQARLSMKLAQGDFILEGQELTHQHWLRNKASKIHFRSTNLAKSGVVILASQFELNEQGDINGQGNWQIEQLALEKITLVEQVDVLFIKLEQGELSANGEFSFNQNEQVSLVHSDNHFRLTKASYQGSAATRFTKILLDTFTSLEQLTLDVSIVGDIEQPELLMSSSLNEALKGAFKKQITDKLVKFKAQVSSGLNEKLAQSLQLNKQASDDLIDFEALLSDTDKSLEQLKNSDVVKQQREKLKNKVTDKLKSKLGDLFG